MHNSCDAIHLLIAPTMLPVDLLDLAWDLRLSVHSKINSFAKTWLQYQNNRLQEDHEDEEFAKVLPDASLMDLQLIVRTINAVQLVESTTQRSLMKRTYLCTTKNNYVILPLTPLLNIIQVRYEDSCNQAMRIMESKDYTVDTMHAGGVRVKVADKISDNRPIYKHDPIIEVKYEAGYNRAADISMIYKNAIINLVKQFYHPTGPNKEQEILDHITKIQRENKKFSSMIGMISAQNVDNIRENIYQYSINMHD